jgi:hypothetical protein
MLVRNMAKIVDIIDGEICRPKDVAEYSTSGFE